MDDDLDLVEFIKQKCGLLLLHQLMYLTLKNFKDDLLPTEFTFLIFLRVIYEDN